jgi:hypothetical protein
MEARPPALVFDLAYLGIMGFFCALMGVYHGWDAAFVAGMLVFLAYCAGRSVN